MKKLPVRVVIFFLLFLGMTCMSGGLNSMGFAVICMADQSFATDLSNASSKCPYAVFENGSRDNTGYSAEFDWSTSLQGCIISASSWGALIVVFCSWTIDRYGPKWIYLSCGLVAAVSNLVTPLAASKVGWLLTVRIIQGTGAALNWSVLTYSAGAWASTKEIGIVLSAASSGNSVGVLLNVALAGEFCKTIGWRAIFYFWGGLTLVWCILWGAFYANSVNETWLPVSKEEKSYIQSGKTGKPENLPTAPWSKMFTSSAVVAIAVASFGGSWFNYFMNDFLPTYLKKILFMPSYLDGTISAATLVVQIIARNVFGILGDKMTCVSLTWNLRILSGIALMVPAVSLVGMAFLDCTYLPVIIFLLVIENFFMCSMNAGHMKSIVLVAPHFISTVCMFSQVPGFLAAVAGPMVLPLLMPNYALIEWRNVFLVTFGIMMFCGIFWISFGSGEKQSWSEPVSKTIKISDDKLHSEYGTIDRF